MLPTGASTGSKRAEALYGDADAVGPTHFAQAIGCRVTDVDGNEYLDCTMALGSVALGYAEPNVTRAVVDAIAAGHVAALSNYREVDVAERLCGVIPCADRVQFLKTGAEAMAAAVRIARTYTARDVVVGSGYFGWLDWSRRRRAWRAVGDASSSFGACRSTTSPRSRPRSARLGRDLAAIVLEPVVERLPSKEWIARARELATAAGAVLIFDEIKTGFRLRTGGYQQFADVVPDLAAFGKAMANGYPLSAVVGDRDVMDAAKRTWISSTLASEAASLAAATAVLAWHDQADVCDSLWHIGAEMRRAVSSAIEASGVKGVTVDGIDPMWMLRCDDSGARTSLPRARRGARRVVQARRVQLSRRSRTTKMPSAPSKPARATRSSSCETRKRGSDRRSRDRGTSRRSRAAHRRPRALSLRRDWTRGLGGGERRALSRRRSHRRHVSRRVHPRHVRLFVADVFPVARRRHARQRRDARDRGARGRSRAHVRHGEPELHGSRARRDRPLRGARRDRREARGEPPRRRSAARPDRRRRRHARAAGAAPHLAAPAPRMAVARDL